MLAIKKGKDSHRYKKVLMEDSLSNLLMELTKKNTYNLIKNLLQFNNKHMNIIVMMLHYLQDAQINVKFGIGTLH